MFRPFHMESFSGERPQRFNDFFSLIHRFVDGMQSLVEATYEYLLRFLFSTIVQYGLGALTGMLLLFGVYQLGLTLVGFFFG